MSFRIHCPDCDVVFEPPAGVLSARCPFCGKDVEVPRIGPGVEISGYRKISRRRPSGWIWFQAHLPVWTNPVLAVSFMLILSASLMQAWLAAHEERSLGAMRRALVEWRSAIAGSDPAAVVTAADRLLDAWTSESARSMAAAEGLSEETVKARRRYSVRADWSRRFDESVKAGGAKGLGKLEELAAQAKSDSALSEMVSKAVRAWQEEREGLVLRELAESSAAFDQGQVGTGWKSVLEAERFWRMTLDGAAMSAATGSKMEEAVRRYAQRFGLVLTCDLTENVFSTPENACARSDPLIDAATKQSGYVSNDLTAQALKDLFRESARYRLDVKISERFGRTFDETPHRTTTLDFTFVLSRDGAIVQRASAVARTPRIPAKTALGMSRLQLSKQSDERVERTLNEAAWESIAGPVNQAIGTLPGPE